MICYVKLKHLNLKLFKTCVKKNTPTTKSDYFSNCEYIIGMEKN